jgi:hypothetical protein
MALFVNEYADLRKLEVERVVQTVSHALGRADQPAGETVVETAQEVFVGKAKHQGNWCMKVEHQR